MATMELNQQFARENHAKLYSQLRFSPPEEIIEKILQYLRESYDDELSLAVDVGCGSGQSTIVLSPHFHQVVGVDASEAQIKEAIASRSLRNIEYKVGFAENLPFADSSVQLVTASNCVHYFQKEVFFREVRRILVPRGVLAMFTYYKIYPILGDSLKEEKIKEISKEFMRVRLQKYFPIEHRQHMETLLNMELPFPDVKKLLSIKDTFPWGLKDYEDMYKTLPRFQNFQAEQGPKAAEELLLEMRKKMRAVLEIKDTDENPTLNFCREYYGILCRREHKDIPEA